MATKSATGFTYSDDNTKMGHVSSYSVMPVATCAPGVPCIPRCYGCKLTRIYTNVKNSYKKNTKMLMDMHLYDELIEDTVGYIQFRHVKYFRWNVAGDFFSPQYIDATIEIARRCPDTTFWAFTKQFKVLRNALAKHEAVGKMPENLNFVLSAWDTWLPPSDLARRYGICYVRDKKGLFQIPSDAFQCEGDCEHCLKCSQLKAGESVVINMH